MGTQNTPAETVQAVDFYLAREYPNLFPTYNVFVDERTGANLLELRFTNAYDASAVANHYADRGYAVQTDLWDAVVPTAMLSPRVYQQVAAYPV